tara:strand:+ start:271 stop:690 length:420 start_codon:yes stop_codon:yes gene_type:complete
MKKNKISKKYRPTEKEKFMNNKMKEYFRKKLLKWKNDLLRGSGETIANLKESENLNQPDIADRASLENDKNFELKTRDRARKLIMKINKAIKKIDNGTYGYCEETDEPISVKRLNARPIATLSIEAQERHEKMEKIKRD